MSFLKNLLNALMFNSKPDPDMVQAMEKARRDYEIRTQRIQVKKYPERYRNGGMLSFE